MVPVEDVSWEFADVRRERGEELTYPGSCEEEDVETNESNHGRGDWVVVWLCCTHDSSNELCNDHSDSTIDENLAATESLNDIEGNRCGAHIDQRRNKGDQERILDRA